MPALRMMAVARTIVAARLRIVDPILVSQWMQLLRKRKSRLLATKREVAVAAATAEDADLPAVTTAAVDAVAAVTTPEVLLLRRLKMAMTAEAQPTLSPAKDKARAEGEAEIAAAVIVAAATVVTEVTVAIAAVIAEIVVVIVAATEAAMVVTKEMVTSSLVADAAVGVKEVVVDAEAAAMALLPTVSVSECFLESKSQLD